MEVDDMTDWKDPEVEELNQSESPSPLVVNPVPVDVQGPVKVQQMPAQTGSTRNYSVVDTDATKITKNDPRRSRLRIWTQTQPVYVGYTQAEALGTQAAILPTGLILEIGNLNEVWVRSATAGQTAVVSALNDQWTQ
jgi:hypothetical protein